MVAMTVIIMQTVRIILDHINVNVGMDILVMEGYLVQVCIVFYIVK
jgi:hypothetical protein